MGIMLVVCLDWLVDREAEEITLNVCLLLIACVLWYSLSDSLMHYHILRLINKTLLDISLYERKVYLSNNQRTAKTTEPIYLKFSVKVLITLYNRLIIKKGFFKIYILKGKKSIKSTVIMRFTMEIFVYRWLLLVSITVCLSFVAMEKIMPNHL